ncbi:hypothetical protein [Halobaculum sp. MBLA0143]|uniref:hypothetical protein n=1 Tax=Halobaculum sp. MBLA0143 TaxID=3079933 RepID=UPI0035252F0B
MQRRGLLVGLAVVGLVLLAGCTASSEPTGPTGPPGSPTPTATPATGIVVETWDVANGTDGRLIVPVTVKNQGPTAGDRAVIVEAEVGNESVTVRREVRVPAGESASVEIRLSVSFQEFLNDGSLNLRLAGEG